jgi:hypothetical protein
MATIPVGSVETRVLRGHYLTRSEAAERAGLSAAELSRVEGLVRITGALPTCEEAYPAFQFVRGGGIVPGLREVVTAVEESFDCLSLAAYLTASHPHFGGASIVDELCAGCEADAVIAALRAA